MKLIKLTGAEGEYILIPAKQIVEVDTVKTPEMSIAYACRVWRLEFDNPLYVMDNIASIAQQLESAPEL